MPATSPSPAPVPGFDGEIALALSGGGYRAAGFHLGALSYLQALGWEESLSQISTVSGGTFVGTAYLCARVDDEPFEAFAERFYRFLESTHLVREALIRLGRRDPDVPSGREDLIVSIARVYGETFMAGADGRPRTFGELLNAELPLRDVIFNATEFKHGLAFRFRCGTNRRGRIGNYFLSVPRELAAKIQLADVVAASSCFPGGFEPLGFPGDFAWEDGRLPELPPKLQGLAEHPLPLMDGGIYDNQGLSSLMDSDDRDPERLGMVLVSDVDQKQDDLYAFPAALDLGLIGGLRLQTVDRLSLLLILACLGTLFAAVFRWWSAPASDWTDLFGFGMPILLAVATGLLVGTLRKRVRQAVASVPQAGFSSWKQLRRLTVDQLANMLNLRATSLIALTSSVFMTRIRRMVSKQAYRRDSYRGKLVANTIYSLQDPERFSRLLEQRDVPRPSPALQAVIESAATMPTTLWFDEDEPWRLPSLVASGQATLVYKLMMRVAREQDEDGREHAELWERLRADWERLRADPYALLPLPAPDPAPPLPPGAGSRRGTSLT